MKTRTSKAPRYIPVHIIREQLREIFPPGDIESILSYHALTGCDTVSYFAGIGKKTSWRIFVENHLLLHHLGKGELVHDTIASAESFVMKLYNINDADKCDMARVILFSKCRTPESLPPTSDALHHHIQRAHYQATVWRQAVYANPTLPSPQTVAWVKDNDKLLPKLMSLTPIPDSFTEIITCGCTKGCTSGRCSCRSAALKCTAACKCRGIITACRNC